MFLLPNFQILLQNFAKSLLDVADNMGRASSVVKDSFAKIDTSKDTAGAVPLLKTLLEGVEMTEKQLTEVSLFTLDTIFYCVHTDSYCVSVKIVVLAYAVQLPLSFCILTTSSMDI